MKHLKYIALTLTFAVICSLICACGKNSELKDSISESLLISPASVAESADKMENSNLISIFENTLYSNSDIILGWIINANLNKDENSVLKSDYPENIQYVLVTDIQDTDALQANFKAAFSSALLSRSVYPMLFEGDYPLFIEEDGNLFINMNVGGSLAFAPDFTRANVVKKGLDSFEIEVPMTTVDNQEGEVFVYKIVQQKGNWVLDNHYLFYKKL